MRVRRPRRTPEEKATLRDARDARADRLEDRLAVPVIAAAAVSVPAVFLSVLTDGTSATIGTALNWASLAVLTAESAVLFILTGRRLAWLWRHKWTLVVLAIAIPAVIFVIAPAQSLRVVVRLVQFFGAIRVLRAGRIVKAGRVLARRIGWDGPWRYLPILAGSVLAAGLVAVVLSDPTSTTRRLLADLPVGLELALVLLAAAILAVATFVVVRYRRRATGSTGAAGNESAGAAAAAGSGRAGGADGGGEPVGDRLGQFDRRCLHHHPDQ